MYIHDRILLKDICTVHYGMSGGEIIRNNKGP